MTTTEKSQALESLIAGMVSDVKETVTEIESGRQVTQNHYGAYMQIIGMMETPEKQNLLAIALIRAGANTAGIASALRILQG